MTIQDIYKIAPNWKSIVESKVVNYKKLNKDLSEYSVELHNGTWCPDCERESTELFALIESFGVKAPSLTIISYEDIEKYKLMKISNTLGISCLPTIIFKKKNQNVLTIKEKAYPSFIEVISRI